MVSVRGRISELYRFPRSLLSRCLCLRACPLDICVQEEPLALPGSACYPRFRFIPTRQVSGPFPAACLHSPRLHKAVHSLALPARAESQWRSGFNRNLWEPSGTPHCGSCKNKAAPGFDSGFCHFWLFRILISSPLTSVLSRPIPIYIYLSIYQSGLSLSQLVLSFTSPVPSEHDCLPTRKSAAGMKVSEGPLFLWHIYFTCMIFLIVRPGHSAIVRVALNGLIECRR